MRYVAGQRRRGTVDLFGHVTAPDIKVATEIAQRRWPGCGVMPWAAYKQLRRAQLSLELLADKEIADGRVQ